MSAQMIAAGCRNGKKGISDMAKRECRSSAKRRLFVIDIENIQGKAILTEEDAIATRNEIEGEFEIGESDLVLIGTSHKNNFLSAKFAWPGAQHCFKPGHNAHVR